MIPEVGKEYYFFDDGKTSPSRCYKAKVLREIPWEEGEEVVVDKYDYDLEQTIPTSLQDIYKEESEEHDWIFSREPTPFLECSIPGYDKNTVFFGRTKDGGWFSFDIQSRWQGGRLDVTGEIFKDAKEYFNKSHGPSWYEKQLKEKGELIE